MAQRKKRPDYVAPNTRQRPAARSDKRELQRTSRAERSSAALRESRRRSIRRVLVGGASLTVLLASVVGYLVFDNRRDAALDRELTAGGVCSTDDKSDPTDAPGRNHVPAPAFAVDPPAGGNHTFSVQKAGVFSEENAKELGPIVHALEHGYVVLWHQPDLPDGPRKVLTDLADSRPNDVLVVERAGLEVAVAATAWGRRLLCTQAVAAPLAAFADEYIGGGPEDVPRG